MAIIDRRGLTVGGSAPSGSDTPHADIAIKTACRVATTGNITLAGEQTIDAIAVVEGNRVLVKNQTDATLNGIYVASTGNWQRADDFEASSDLASGLLVAVVFGTVSANQVYQLTAPDPIVLGADNLTFVPVTQLTGEPIVLAATGQSETAERPSFAWSPPPNLFVGNNLGVDGDPLTAFVPASGATINYSIVKAALVARAFPNSPVYLIFFAIGSQTIAHWMTGAPYWAPATPPDAPDMYANTKSRIEQGLALLGLTKIDALDWWQGVNKTATPETHVADLETVFARFKAESWFPRATPVNIYGLAPSFVSATAVAQDTDRTNKQLLEFVAAEPATRSYIDTGIMPLTPVSHWDATVHPSGIGHFVAGSLGGQAYLQGVKHSPVLDPRKRIVAPEFIGRPAFRNLIRYGEATTNPWPLGTTFTSVAGNTSVLIAPGIRWSQNSTAVVTLRKTADAPTMAQVAAKNGGNGYRALHCIDIEVMTADTSIALNDFAEIQFEVSGLNSAFLGFGADGAQELTAGFWLKNSKTGVRAVNVRNRAGTRSFRRALLTSVANVWEWQTVTVPGDEAGTWDTDSGIGIILGIPLMLGGNYVFDAGAIWQAFDVRADAAVANVLDTVGNRFKVAMIKAEEGIGSSSFEQIPQEVLNAVQTGGNQTLTGGIDVTTTDAGTKTTGTFTPAPKTNNFQKAVNGGAHTLAPPATDCSMVVQYTNNASAGAVTTSGFTKVTGDLLTTVNGDDFLLTITVCNGFSHLHIQQVS